MGAKKAKESNKHRSCPEMKKYKLRNQDELLDKKDTARSFVRGVHRNASGRCEFLPA